MTAEMLIPRRYQVVDRLVETRDVATLTLAPIDRPLPVPAPGQFAMLTVFGVGEVPISVSAMSGFVHTVRAVGAVTKALCAVPPGTVLGVRGPFGGAGWDLAAARGRDVLIVAGGIGLAPLRPVLQGCLADRDAYGSVALLAGARMPADLLYDAQLRAVEGVEVRLTVDRATSGWRGHIGVVTTLLEQAAFDPRNCVAYVCGPEIMMRFTAEALLRHGVPGPRVQLSLERNMRCGDAWCGHCQLGPLIVCRDGPVVTYDQVAPLLTVREL